MAKSKKKMKKELEEFDDKLAELKAENYRLKIRISTLVKALEEKQKGEPK